MKNLGLVQKFFSEQMERSAGGGGVVNLRGINSLITL